MKIRLFLLILILPAMHFLHQEFHIVNPPIILSPMTTLETKRIHEDIQKMLPKWRKQFEKYGKKYNLPWTLIAAVSYQESKWDNDAISFTGVRGLMQLTTQTAEHVGVSDREDPHQSIQGGAYYLKYLYQKSPGHLQPSDRWVQALAGYNMGWAHLRDVHRLARSKGMNAYRWEQLKILLPMKANKKYLSHFNFGLARGNETVDFIESVIGYYQFLNLRFPEKIFLNRNIASINTSTVPTTIQTTTQQSQILLNF